MSIENTGDSENTFVATAEEGNTLTGRSDNFIRFSTPKIHSDTHCFVIYALDHREDFPHSWLSTAESTVWNSTIQNVKLFEVHFRKYLKSLHTIYLLHPFDLKFCGRSPGVDPVLDSCDHFSFILLTKIHTLEMKLIS